LRLHTSAHGLDSRRDVRLIGYRVAMSNMSVQPADRSWTATKVVAVIVAILSAGYMLPWAIAAVRDVPHWLVFWINLLLGWTIIGWIVALVMSLRTQRLIVS
jgi:hypothetical protein